MTTRVQVRPTRVRALLAVGVALVAALVVLACGSGSGANSGTTTTTGGSGGSSTTSAKHFKVGDQVKVGSTWMVTINSIKSSQGDDVSQPKSGNVFIIVDVSSKNISAQEQNLSSLLNFTFKDSTGQKYDETIVNGATPPDGKVAAGDQLRGQLAFEAPSSMHQFTLAFEADVLSSGQTIWDLSV